MLLGNPLRGQSEVQDPIEQLLYRPLDSVVQEQEQQELAGVGSRRGSAPGNLGRH